MEFQNGRKGLHIGNCDCNVGPTSLIKILVKICTSAPTLSKQMVLVAYLIRGLRQPTPTLSNKETLCLKKIWTSAPNLFRKCYSPPTPTSVYVILHLWQRLYPELWPAHWKYFYHLPDGKPARSGYPTPQTFFTIHQMVNSLCLPSPKE